MIKQCLNTCLARNHASPFCQQQNRLRVNVTLSSLPDYCDAGNPENTLSYAVCLWTKLKLLFMPKLLISRSTSQITNRIGNRCARYFNRFL